MPCVRVLSTVLLTHRPWIDETMKIAIPALASLLIITGAASLGAQQKRALDHADYDIWNRIQNIAVSSDGLWLAYRLVPGDGEATLVLRSLSDTRSLEIERGNSSRFTADAEHLIALISPMEDSSDLGVTVNFKF